MMTSHCKDCGDIVEYRMVNGRTQVYDPIKRSEHICLKDIVKFRRDCMAQTEWEWSIHGEERKIVDEYFKRREEEVRLREQQRSKNGAY